MFHRLVFADAAALFTLVAFITAVSIFVTIAWRALRMPPPQVERFEHLPFATATPAARGIAAAPESFPSESPVLQLPGRAEP